MHSGETAFNSKSLHDFKIAVPQIGIERFCFKQWISCKAHMTDISLNSRYQNLSESDNQEVNHADPAHSGG
ncbi:hypothetical protein [Desulfonema ishimotonii]|uniref:hypothetical protein n=1 Tax=Desulfonema ishimotonii TaxID=45657 RepID=UPI000F581F1A|nr:hypothetical protein [Desulfonema ishimotonii]